jgi:hypothetical protein
VGAISALKNLCLLFTVMTGVMCGGTKHVPTFQTQPKAGSAQLVRKLGTFLITLVSK